MVGLMAKKKPGPTPDPSRVRSAVTNIRSTPEWKGWLERLSEFDRAPSISDLVDRMATTYARKIRFSEPPPKR